MKEQRAMAVTDLTGTLASSRLAFGLADYLMRMRLLNEGAGKNIDGYRRAFAEGKITYHEMTEGCINSFYRGLERQFKDDVRTEAERFLALTDIDSYIYRTSREIFGMIADRYTRVVAVTGLPEELAVAMKKIFPFTTVLGSQGELLEGSLYTGEMIKNLARPFIKGNALEEYDRFHPVDWSHSLAAGNTEQDIPMWRLVSGDEERNERRKRDYLRIAFVCNAKPEMRNLAQQNRWYVVDMDARDPKYNIYKVKRGLERLTV